MDKITIKGARVNNLKNINIEIPKNKLVVITGVSGSGKSTFIKMLYREEKPDKGSIFIGGINVARLKDRKVYKLRRKLGIVFQDYRLLPKQTVYENVAFALEVIGAKKDEIRVKVLKALEDVGLKHKLHEYPDHLSGGEQQRVAIARAIVNDPKLLLCDEPTGNLDPEKSAEIMKVLDSINKTRGTTIIMATHDKEIVNRMKKRVLVINNGMLVLFKKQEKMFQQRAKNLCVFNKKKENSKNTCNPISCVVLYFSIPHGASTSCLCQMVGRGDETAGGNKLNFIWRNKQHGI